MTTPNNSNYDYNPFDPNPSYQQGNQPSARPSFEQPQFDSQFAQPQYGQPQQFANVPAQQPQPMYAAYNAAGLPSQPKNKIVAAVLAFFLGSFGVHNFYLGYNSKAIAQLSISVIGLITAIIFIGFIMLMITGIWAFVEFIMILLGAGQYNRDAHGVPLI
ncbi:NINE protein [Corynebacterium breve]|uniref:NINE protein n=1 Tax=Corynebacterium breve TaxID=3049799 RepID=A0ABY8VEP1_9CORY|nr:TM2 domain-containing protein [Corynebacterium breve]WIM67567.1 NINE protein [Corynebacterium breve]